MSCQQIFSIGGRPVFRGLFEDNDPSKRLQMVVNYNTDVLAVLGVVEFRAASGERNQRGLQDRRQLRDLRSHPLSAARHGAPTGQAGHKPRGRDGESAVDHQRVGLEIAILTRIPRTGNVAWRDASFLR